MKFGRNARPKKIRGGKIKMSARNGNDVEVERDECAVWQVSQGEERMSVVNYRYRGHAMAFARAVAYGCHVEMVVYEADGRILRHQRASLTYPLYLD